MTYIASAILAFVYRLRGGGFMKLSDLVCRVIWGVSLAASYIAIHRTSANLCFAASIVPSAVVSLMFIPHAYCQNMGRWPTPQHKWPSFYMPVLTDTEWQAAGVSGRTAYDFFSMLGVGFFRALIVFTPLCLIQYVQGRPPELYCAIEAVTAISIFQSVAYLVGWHIPFSAGSSLTKNSTEWSEFLTGAIYALGVLFI